MFRFIFSFCGGLNIGEIYVIDNSMYICIYIYICMYVCMYVCICTYMLACLHGVSLEDRMPIMLTRKLCDNTTNVYNTVSFCL